MIPPGKRHAAKSPELLLLTGNHCEAGRAMAQCAAAQYCDSAVYFPAGNPSSRGLEMLGGPWGLCPVSHEVTML